MERQIILPDVVNERQRNIRRLWQRTRWFTQHWLLLFTLLFGIYWITPFIAPVLMHIGWIDPANIIYTVYGTQCHQMAQRSFFFFGPQPMYTISQLPVQLTGDETSNLLVLRAFIGNSDIGWKVAWSDRMVYMYGGVWFAAIIFLLRHQQRSVRPLKWYLFVLLLLPIAIDGGTHWLSDIAGGWVDGFRYNNQWLATLTGNLFPPWFYVGDTLGSFNSWIRLLSGVLFGIACVWFSFPYLDSSMRDVTAQLQIKLEQLV